MSPFVMSFLSALISVIMVLGLVIVAAHSDQNKWPFRLATYAFGILAAAYTFLTIHSLYFALWRAA